MSAPNQFLLYTAPNGAVKVEVFFKNETVWLTQKTLAELFGVKVPAINKHLKNIFESGELIEDSAVSISETTAADGKNYSTRYYSLDAIIALGHHRPDGGGNYLRSRRRHENLHGPDDVETRAARENIEIGCDGGEKLFE
jgi:hypothetical protein